MQIADSRWCHRNEGPSNTPLLRCPSAGPLHYSAVPCWRGLNNVISTTPARINPAPKR
jgi:hypothetical protein